MPRPMSIRKTPGGVAWRAENQRIGNSSVLGVTVKKLQTGGAEWRAAQDAKTTKDAAEKLEAAKKMDPSATKLTDEYFPEMIDPALAITGAIVAGVTGGYAFNKGSEFLARLKSAMKSPAKKDKTRKAEIERAQQAAKNLMPPMPKK